MGADLPEGLDVLLIDGKLDRGDRWRHLRDGQPRHRGGAGRRRRRHRRGHGRGDRGCPQGLRRDRLVDRPRLPRALPAPAARRAPGRGRAAARADHRRGGRPVVPDRRAPVRHPRRGPGLLRRPGRAVRRVARRPGRQGVVRGAHPPSGVARGSRGGRRDHPVELPAPDQLRQARSCARRGLHRGAQAGARHAVVRLGGRSHRGGAHRSARRVCSTSSTRRTTRSARSSRATPASTSCRSPVRPPPAGRSCAAPRSTSPGSSWSWAASPRS